MADINKIDRPFFRPTGDTRPVAPRRAESGRGEAFDSRLNSESALVRYESKPLVARRASAEQQPSREEMLEDFKSLLQAVRGGFTDPQDLTKLIFASRHLDMIGVPLTKDRQPLLDEWNQITATLVQPTLDHLDDLRGAGRAGEGALGAEEVAKLFERVFGPSPESTRLGDGATHHYDALIARAVEFCPGLSPVILKSLLAQESNFNTQVINQYGYAGIAQFGRDAAREVGLRVGVAGSATDERLDPSKAIPAAARLLDIKAQRLREAAFSRYGEPAGVEFWKFVLAAYNGGEGTVTLAMGNAYRAGLARARSEGRVGTDAVGFARRFASQWENLKLGGLDSPLAQAAARYFPSIAAAKVYEIGNYPTAIITRMKGNGG